MNIIKFIVACCATLFLLLSNQVFAAQCSAVFPDVIATHGNGNGNSWINFGFDSRLVNNPDTVLSTLRIDGNSIFDVNSCGSADCTASNSSAEKVSVNFRRGGGSVNYSPPSFQTTTFGIRGTNNYRNISAQSDATMQFGDAYDVYFFENLSLSSNNTLNLSAGKTYYFRKFSVGSNVNINVIGSGTATVFVDAGVNFTSPSMINSPSENRSGDVSKLVMHTKGSVTFGSRSTFSGALYAKNITFTSASYLFGVASGERVTLGSNSVLTYDSTVFDADFGEICDFSSPVIAVVNYQFDECKYTGVGNEVLDQLGSFNANASSGVSSSSNATINRSLDLSVDDTSDWVSVPKGAIDGLDSFSISVWINTSVSKSQQEIFQALGSSASDDEVELYLINSSTLNIKLKDRDKNFSIGRNVTNGQWHHLVVTRVQDDICLYVNGGLQDCDDGFPNRSLSVPNNAVVIGQEQDSFGGSFTSEQSFEGKIDEFIIFDGALTADDVLAIYNHQSAGNNYDGSTRSAVSCQSLLAYYAFEQSSISALIEDTSGSGNHGSNISGISTANGKYCRGFDSNGTNSSSATSNAFNSNVNLLNDVGRQGSISFWFNSNTEWNRGGYNNGGERTLFDASLDLPGGSNSDKYFTLKVRNNGRLRLSLEDSNDRGFMLTESSSSVLRSANTWYNIAITWDYSSGRFQIYLDGVLIINQVHSTSGQISGLGDIIFGDNASTYSSNSSNILASNYSANGRFDEVRIYDEVISQVQVLADLNENNCVDDVIHHYEIIHDGVGLTCAAEPITIKACTNSDCTTLSTEPVSLDFTVDGATKAAVTFTGSTDTNNPNFSFNHTTPETLTLSVASATVPTTNPVQCSGGNCDMTFADSEFRFLYGASNSEIIANQVSGAVFSGLKIQARKSVNGECKGLFSGSVSVKLAQENRPSDPTDTNAGLMFRINSTDGTDGDDIRKYSAFSDDIPLNFTINNGEESVAVIPGPVYLDAGRIRLQASYNKNGISLLGNSNEFWVRPDRFEINSTAKYNVTTDSTFTAGKTFDFNVSALNLHGAVTQNYLQTDGELALKLVRVLPTNTASVNGLFTVANNLDLSDELTNTFVEQTLTSFKLGTKGISEFSGAKYNEVGNIAVDLQDAKYGGLDDSGWVIPAAEVTLGRFIPAYFEQTLNTAGNLDSYHNANSGCTALNWAYTGQKVLDTENKGTIHYGLKPVIDIVAYNADKQRTKNYTLAEDINSNKILMKLSNSGVTITSPTFDQKQLQVGGVVKEDKSENVAVSSDIETGILAAKAGEAGTMTYTFSELDRFSYVRNHLSFLKPFEAEIPFITEAVLDDDGVKLRVDNTPLDSTDNPTEDFTIMGVNIRFARMVLDNAYGSENSTLRSPIYIEIFNGHPDSAYVNFSKAVDENCLVPMIKDKKPGNKYSGNMTLWDYRLIDIDNTDGLEVDDTSASITKSFNVGSHENLFFAAPSKQGVLEFEYEVPDWLKFDWKNEDSDNNGPHDVNPSARLNFGLYRGNDRIISWREVSN
ncbi:LamG domain-containing protein [Cognaticolwellia mytili]|uniref:LamG domain-containing protein n=1 Tax=Cognaticolwellia mytili TaxID=1888913 RepID=UPI000A16F94E|nr:LamG domain-containing protein [Cognaticolwellia mytili]